MKAMKYVVFKIEMRADGNKVEVGIEDVTDRVDVIARKDEAQTDCSWKQPDGRD